MGLPLCQFQNSWWFWWIHWMTSPGSWHGGLYLRIILYKEALELKNNKHFKSLRKPSSQSLSSDLGLWTLNWNLDLRLRPWSWAWQFYELLGYFPLERFWCAGLLKVTHNFIYHLAIENKMMYLHLYNVQDKDLQWFMFFYILILTSCHSL